MRRVLSVFLALCALALVACGDSSEDAGESDAPPAAEESSPDEPKLTATPEETREDAKVVCGLKPPKEVAKDFGMSTSDPDRIASRYARGYVPKLEQAAYEGCLEGLR